MTFVAPQSCLRLKANYTILCRSCRSRLEKCKIWPMFCHCIYTSLDTEFVLHVFHTFLNLWQSWLRNIASQLRHPNLSLLGLNFKKYPKLQKKITVKLVTTKTSLIGANFILLIICEAMNSFFFLILIRNGPGFYRYLSSSNLKTN